MDVLKENWSPVWELRSCCLAVGALLESPEEGSPLNVDAANLIRCKDWVAFDSMAKMFTSLAIQTTP